MTIKCRMNILNRVLYIICQYTDEVFCSSFLVTLIGHGLVPPPPPPTPPGLISYCKNTLPGNMHAFAEFHECIVAFDLLKASTELCKVHKYLIWQWKRPSGGQQQATVLGLSEAGLVHNTHHLQICNRWSCWQHISSQFTSTLRGNSHVHHFKINIVLCL